MSQVTVRISDGEQADLEARMQELNLKNLPEFFRVAAKLFLGFSPWFLGHIGEQAHNMGIPPAALIECMAIDQRSSVDAEMKVSGVPQFANHIIIEGDESGFELLRGEQLYKRLLSKKMYDLEAEKAERDKRQAIELESYRRQAEAADAVGGVN